MSCETMAMSTPKKHTINGIDEMYLIEDIEKKLESFNHLLERSTEKEKGHIRRINEQAAALSTLQIENGSLKEENEKLRSVIDSYMKNFVCFMENLKRTSPLEEENLSLKQRLEQSLNETSDKIVDLELEKDQLQKANTELNEENDKLKKEVGELKENIGSLNEYILNSFKQTIAYTREGKIKDLEDALKAKDLEVTELKAEMEKSKETHDKSLKQKTLEYELLKMDYQSAIVQNIQARQMNWKGDSNKAKADKNDKSEKPEKHDRNEKSAVATKNQNNRVFQIITTKPEEVPETRSSSRRTRGAYKKNTAIQTMKDEIEKEEYLDKGDEDFELDIEIEDDSFDEEDEEEETYVPRKGKRKARETKKKHQTKKVKKNENKELLLVNRNAIQYHLFQ